MGAAGAILLAIGAGGALKQVLVSAGLSDLLARVVLMYAISPLLLGWLVAVGIRLAAGSATVATITAVGVMPGVVASSGVSPELVVLAIGAGSVFFSHVNDPGFCWSKAMSAPARRTRSAPGRCWRRPSPSSGSCWSWRSAMSFERPISDRGRG